MNICPTPWQTRLPSSRSGLLRMIGTRAWCRASATLLFLVSALACLETFAETSVAVSATSPGADATVARDQPVYCRIDYRTDRPVSIWVRPYSGGKVVERHRTGAAVRNVGNGQALAWFSLDEAADVDELRIVVGGGQPWREWEAATVPLHLQVSDDAMDDAVPSPWVAALKGVGRTTPLQLDLRARPDGPPPTPESPVHSGLGVAVLLLLVGGLTAPVWAMWKWRGLWRLGAAAPATLMGFVVLRILIGTAADPSSHSLWLFEILSSGIVALAVLASLVVARRFTTEPG